MSRRSVATAVAVSTLVVAALVTYTAPDHRRPSVVAAAPDAFTKAMTGNNRMLIELSCDEPCELARPKLSSWSTSTRPPIQAVEISSVEEIERTRDADAGSFAASVSPRVAVTLDFSAAQARWLRSQLGADRKGNVALDFDVRDYNANSTPVYISARE